MQQCTKNAENRSKNTISPSLGRKSYNQVYDSMEKENLEANINQATVWKAAHKHKNVECLPTHKRNLYVHVIRYHHKMCEQNQIEEEEKRKAASDHGSATGIDDFEHDEVAIVFGSEK